jgi:HEAT repeat protein
MLRRTFCALVLLVIAFPSLHAAAPTVPLDKSRIKTLVENLDDDNFHVRQDADVNLRAMGKGVLAQLVAEKEQTKSLEVSWRLGRIIHDLTIDERFDSLLRMLGDKDAQTRERADYALRQAGQVVVPLLQKELRPNLPREQRQRMEKIIAELGPER